MNNDKILFIMGNGPSLKEIVYNKKCMELLKKNNTFGLNSSYRKYDELNFFPTYFGCFDFIVNENHKESFEKLVLGDNKIQEFYFIGSDKEGQNLYDKEVRDNKKFKKFDFKLIRFVDENCNPKNPETWFKDKTLKEIHHLGSSGCDASQIGILKGFNKIYLIGCDCNYDENFSSNIKKDENNILTVEAEFKENKNYWFDNYQQTGDKFNVPNCLTTQMRSWERLYKYYYKDENIINLSNKSNIPYFPKKNIKDLFNIGIIGIFIKEYVIFFNNFINNIESKFLPNNKKHYFIITDNYEYIEELSKKNNINFTIFNENYIGWPYETLYRFKYFNKINKKGAFDNIDYLYFFNSNIRIINKEYDLIPDNDFIFVKHNSFHNCSFKELENLEKSEISTACEYKEDKEKKDYVYCGGGFYGGETKAFIEMSKKLENNIDIDEKNNFIAIWHDETHLNYYINNILNKKKCNILSHLYHGNGNINNDFLIKEGFKFIFLPKDKFIKNLSQAKDFTNMKKQIHGKIILNKYNKNFF